MKSTGFKFFVIFLFNVLILISGYYGWNFQFMFNGSASIAIASILYYEKWSIKLLTFIGPVVYLLVWIQAKNLNPLPIVFFPPLFLGILLFLPVRTKHRILLTLSFLIVSLLGYFVMDTWFEFAMNREEKKIIGKSFPQIGLVDDKGDFFNQLNLDTSSLFVFDCWSSNCGICFRDMPLFEQLQKVEKNKGVKFYTLNLPLQRDTTINLPQLLARYYSFSNNIYASNLFSKDSLNCLGVPLYILVQNKRILYSGHISLEPKVAAPDLQDKIDIHLTKFAQ